MKEKQRLEDEELKRKQAEVTESEDTEEEDAFDYKKEIARFKQKQELSKPDKRQCLPGMKEGVRMAELQKTKQDS